MIKVLNKKEEQKVYRQTCYECGAELEYTIDDTYIGALGSRYITCPNCNKKIANESIEGIDEVDISEYVEGVGVGERFMTVHRLKLRDALGDIKRVNYIEIKENLMNREIAEILAEEKVRLWKAWRASTNKKEKDLITGKINQIENFLFVNDNIYNENGWLLQGKAVSYSYAITCHKIQGGENDCVIINSLDFNKCQNRKVLEQLRYVGVTRAKKALIILK